MQLRLRALTHSWSDHICHFRTSVDTEWEVDQVVEEALWWSLISCFFRCELILQAGPQLLWQLMNMFTAPWIKVMKLFFSCSQPAGIAVPFDSQIILRDFGIIFYFCVGSDTLTRILINFCLNRAGCIGHDLNRRGAFTLYRHFMLLHSS